MAVSGSPQEAPGRFCVGCRKARSQCLCADLACISNNLPVWILQHPDERWHPLNTAVIAERGLSQCRLWTGLDFSVHNLLQQHRAQHPLDLALLFPSRDAMPFDQWASRVVHGKHASPRLVVLDGTWRNARELMLRNPFLSAFTAVSLPPEQTEAMSRYPLRKSSRADGFSTLEAILRALQTWDVAGPEKEAGTSDRYQSLLGCLALMQLRQLARMPPDVAARYGEVVPVIQS